AKQTKAHETISVTHSAMSTAPSDGRETRSANDDAPLLPGQRIDDVTRVAVDTAQGVRRERTLELQAQERQARQHGRDAAIVPRRAGLIEDAERSQVRHVRPIACREDY